MKCKTIEDPIYNCDLTIIFTNDLNEVVKKYKLQGNWGEFGDFMPYWVKKLT